MIKVVADKDIPFLRGALDNQAHVRYLAGASICREDVKDADALIVRTRTRCDAHLLEGSSVRFIASATIGYDHIDTPWCDSHNISWVNASGCNARSVRQYVASALASIARKEGHPLAGKTLGVIGKGHTGSLVAELGAQLQMKVLCNDPPRASREGSAGFVPLHQLLAHSHIVSLHIPLETTSHNNTHHLANQDFFRTMKPGGWLINSSRGEVAHTQSLGEALEQQHLQGAILDVWENEPNIHRPLVQLAHIATPHIAGYSADGKANGTAMSVRALSRFFGLGLDQWYPSHLPGVHPPVRELQCAGKTKEEIFEELSLMSYDIYKDSQQLKSSIETFEQQRSNYPVRREPGYYTLQSQQCSPALQHFVQNLGFGLAER